VAKLNRCTAQENKLVRSWNTISYQEAIGSYLESCLDNQEEKVKPEWLSSLGANHDLFFCKGLGFCAKCGAVGSCQKASELLRQDCRGVLPSGSRSRLKRALKGLHPHGASHWPDGSPTSETGLVMRVRGAHLVIESYEVEAVLEAAKTQAGTIAAAGSSMNPVVDQRVSRDDIEEQASEPASSSNSAQRASDSRPERASEAQAEPRFKVPRIDRSRFKFKAVNE